MSPSAQQSAYDALRAAILSLDLAPGERLSERGLEDRLGASRTPIRAALLRLQSEGLTRRDGGWQVAPIDVAEVRSAMEYREVVEAGVVALAARRASDDDLRALLAVAAGSGDDGQSAVLQDGTEFHGALAALTGNAFLVAAITDVLTRLHRTRWLEARSAAARATARAEHTAIVEALLARDGALATERVVAHSRGTRDRLLAMLDAERQRLRGTGVAIVESTASP
ncbi:GntR family transcriptional regulator [Luteimicrobium subarcticum]|uniref:GntR family transcriptional regulator n=1 Tax=Luteimicrobium subarcticum TaxID=620910 RepID=A0A2M8W1D3_9MICO|nr:GntR family transcriptional regulator [Luteimicrobium subarcticum]PJI84725.1 GntR family transcriptional regulator [Luteimicrobium subarcticum]